jgi:UDP-N-acetylglucosamine--N-acetylmuramyl-(pentapeptide) pyrophosphoryl-undecaprenol N-acetylglucosamine transferase
MKLVSARGLGFDLVHQSGKARQGIDPEALRASYGPLGTVTEFFHDVASELAAADLVVARSGAMTSAEIAAAGRPALLVPFAAATHGHQEANARALEKAGAAVVLTEHEATPERVAESLTSLLANPLRLAEMGSAARSLAKPDAASRFCDLVLDVERVG